VQIGSRASNFMRHPPLEKLSPILKHCAFRYTELGLSSIRLSTAGPKDQLLHFKSRSAKLVLTPACHSLFRCKMGSVVVHLRLLESRKTEIPFSCSIASMEPGKSNAVSITGQRGAQHCRRQPRNRVNTSLD